MRKAKFIGTIVAGNSQKEAVASFLRTLNANFDNSKVVFGTSESSGQVFLTSVENLASPMSPTSGEQTCVKLIEDQTVIASKLQLQTEGEMVASANFKLKSCTCPNCNSVLVADNAELLANCIICGTEQDSEEEEGEDNVDVRIVPEGEDCEEVLASADVEHDDVIAALKKRGITVTPEVFEMWLEGMGDVSEADEEAVEAFDDAIVKLLTKPVYAKFKSCARLYDKVLFELGLLEGDESGGVSLASEDEELEVELEDSDIDDAELEAALQASDDMDDEDESEEDESEFDDSEEDEDTEVSDDSDEDESDEDETEDDESEDDSDDGESESSDESEEEEVNEEADACNGGPAVTEDQNRGTIGAEQKATVDDIDFDSELEVDLVHDNIGSSASLASNNVKLVYAPSDNFAESRWYAIANGAPVAVASVQSVGDKASIFATDNFRKGTETLMSQIGVAEGLTTMGFQSLKVRMPVKNIVANRVAEATAAVKQESAQQVASIREDLRAAISTAAVGINKGFFADLANPMKAELFDVLSSVGVQNAEVLIDNAFGSSADDYHKVLLAKAFDLLKKPVDARNEISQAVATASYQRVGAPESAASLSGAVSRQLSHIGVSRKPQAGVMQASAGSPQSHAIAVQADRMRSVVGNLGR